MSDNKDRSMVLATSSTDAKTFPYDIWHMVFTLIWDSEMLDRDDPWDPWGGSRGLRTWFLSTRTVSRQFNLITTKLVFQVLELSERNVIGEDPPRGYAQFKASIISNAQKFYIQPSHDLASQKELIDIVSASPRLIYVSVNTYCNDREDMWTCVSGCLQELSKRAGRYDFQIQEGINSFRILRKVAQVPLTPTAPASSGDSNDLVTATKSPLPRLNKLDLTSYFTSPSPLLSSKFQRLPAMVELSLNFYAWEHTRTNYQRVWDFSNLRDLELYFIDIGKFFNAVDISELADLRKLHIKGCEKFEVAMTPLQTLFSRLKGLEELEIFNRRWQEPLPVSFITGIGASLKVLSLNDMADFATPLAVEDLRQICRYCPGLRKFSLNWTDNLDDQQIFMHTLCSFINVENLDLISKHGFPFDGIDPTSTDPDYDGAQRALDFLCASKTGKRLQTLWIRAENCFRKLEDENELGPALHYRSFGREVQNGALVAMPPWVERFENFPTSDELIEYGRN